MTTDAKPLTIDTSKVAPHSKLPEGELGFGRIFSDHMFVLDFDRAKGWHDARVVPYGPLSLDPAAAVFHYGQEIFDGFKVFRGVDGKLRVFRGERHAARLNDSARRLCMPEIDPSWILAGVDALVRTDASWVPSAPGTALYLRPTLIATEGFLGVRPSDTYTYFLIASPVGAYYAEGLAPVRIWVEREHVRAIRGGLGAAKAGANYAASLYAAHDAKKRGYAQVLWLDAVEHRQVEEVGTMNVFVHLGNEIVTPPLEGSILPGITRDSVLTLLRSWGLPVVERHITIDEIVAAHERGELHEMFGCGTAAVISPIGELGFGDRTVVINDRKSGPISLRLYDEVTGIQYGSRPDTHGWTRVIG